MDHSLKVREAMILAGGFGTRLRSVVHDIPKPMADIAGKPFLEYLLYFLHKQGCEYCVLSVGYKHEYISGFFGDRYMDMKLDYAIEETPLGTGGGIMNGLHYISQNDFFLLNGDSFFDVGLKDLADFHLQKKSEITLSLKQMYRISRYGTVEMKDERIVRFNEKSALAVGTGYINGGVYVLSRNIFDGFDRIEAFSFERDVLEAKTGLYSMYGFVSDGYFIDIGIPEDYSTAQRTLNNVVHLL